MSRGGAARSISKGGIVYPPANLVVFEQDFSRENVERCIQKKHTKISKGRDVQYFHAKIWQMCPNIFTINFER